MCLNFAAKVRIGRQKVILSYYYLLTLQRFYEFDKIRRSLRFRSLQQETSTKVLLLSLKLPCLFFLQDKRKGK